MSTDGKNYTVRIDEPANSLPALRKFAQTVSATLVRLWQSVQRLVPVNYTRSISAPPTLSMTMYDSETGRIFFLPGVRFIFQSTAGVNSGFELDVSGELGQGIGSLVQGYTANYGNKFGSKLVAGVVANNENFNIPRFDIGFKVKRGATMELYGTDGANNARAGQLRVTVGPTGGMILTRYVSGDRWEVMGGFGPNHELVCGWRNTGWPGSADTWGTTSAPTVPFSVYGRTGGIGSESAYTKTPVATIDDAGVCTASKLTLKSGDNSVTLTATGATGAMTFNVVEKEFGDGTKAKVLCAT